MLTDGRRVPKGETLKADLCVIGAGAAGISIARSFNGSARSVILLESGGFDVDSRTQDLAKGRIVGIPLEPSDPPALRDTRLRYFGGTTNHFAGASRALAPWDFEARPWIPLSGWPMTYDDMLPWYRQAADVYHLPPGASFDPAALAANVSAAAGTPSDAAQPGIEEKDFITAVTWTAPLRFGRVYRKELEDSSNVNLVVWSNAVKLAANDAGTAVESVECATLSGNRFRVQATAYVVALGGIENARLLLASNDVRPDGLGNESGFVGRCFMEHMRAVSGFVVLTAPPARFRRLRSYLPPIPEGSPFREGELEVGGVLLLSPSAMERDSLHDLSIAITYPIPEASMERRTRAVGPRAVSELARAVEGFAEATTATVIYVQGEQQPNPESRVRLTRTKDALGVPRVALDWRPTRADYESMAEGMLLAAKDFGRQQLGRVQLEINQIVVRGLDVPAALPDRFPVGTGYHHMGTTRMSTDPTKSVTDGNAKVHTVQNLYVGGSSLWTTSGVAPPTFNIVAFALRLADHLKHSVLA